MHPTSHLWLSLTRERTTCILDVRPTIERSGIRVVSAEGEIVWIGVFDYLT
jgi:hypothetical protein